MVGDRVVVRTPASDVEMSRWGMHEGMHERIPEGIQGYPEGIPRDLTGGRPGIIRQARDRGT
jgi:hypothetical protein